MLWESHAATQGQSLLRAVPSTHEHSHFPVPLILLAGGIKLPASEGRYHHAARKQSGARPSQITGAELYEGFSGTKPGALDGIDDLPSQMNVT